MLQVLNLHVGYNKRQVLCGMSLDVQRGEIVALAGANGSGKSTVLRAVAGLLRPIRGHVVLGGREITGLPPHRINGLGVGYLRQGSGVFSGLSVAENLRLSADATPERSVEPERLLAAFPRLKGLWFRRAGLLSGGERQMLAIAMVLVQQPKCLLLDEPFAKLAPEPCRALTNLLHEMKSQGEYGILLVEQSLGLAARLADRFYLVKGGLAVPLDAGRPPDPQRLLAALGVRPLLGPSGDTDWPSR